MPSSAAGAEFTGTSVPPAQLAADLVFVPVFGEGDKLEDLAGVDEATGGELGRARARGEFRARLYDVFMTPVTTAAGAPGESRSSARAGSRISTPSACAAWPRRAATSRGAAASQSIGWVVRKARPMRRDRRCRSPTVSRKPISSPAPTRRTRAPDRRRRRSWSTAPGSDAGAIAEAVRRGRIIGRRRELCARAVE